MGLALADAFDLGRMQGEDPEIAPLEIAVSGMDTPGQHQSLAVAASSSGSSLALADNVADHPSEYLEQVPKRLVRPLELLGMGIALVLDQGVLADPGIGLAKLDA